MSFRVELYFDLPFSDERVERSKKDNPSWSFLPTAYGGTVVRFDISGEYSLITATSYAFRSVIWNTDLPQPVEITVTERSLAENPNPTRLLAS